MDAKTLEKIVKVLKENDVVEFEIEQEGVKIKLARGVSFHELAENSTASYSSVSYEPNYTVEQRPVAVETPQAVIRPAVSSETVNGNGAAPSGPAAAAVEDTSGIKVDSPIVGTFYRRPSPEADPFVELGDVVRKGQTLCIVEAMKLMNEIEAPCDGKVSRILLDDSNVVEFGETMFVIDPA